MVLHGIFTGKKKSKNIFINKTETWNIFIASDLPDIVRSTGMRIALEG